VRRHNFSLSPAHALSQSICTFPLSPHAHPTHTLSFTLTLTRETVPNKRAKHAGNGVKHAGNQRRASNWLRLIAIDSRRLIATRSTRFLPVTRRINEGRREGGRSFRKERWRWSVRVRRCADVGGRMEKDKNRTIKARICARESPNLNLDLNHEQRASLPRYAYGA
jgi:hypothetical protein